MSNSPMIPMFSPDGVLGYVPVERLKDASAAGGKVAIKMQAPNSSDVGYIPADKANDAVKAGGKSLPYDTEDFGDMGQITWQGTKKEAGNTLARQASGLNPLTKENLVGTAVDPTGAMRGTYNAINEAVMGWQRGKSAPGKLWEAISSAAASPFVSAEAQAKHAEKGESNKILAETTVPAVETAALYGASKGASLAGEQLGSLRAFLNEKLFTAEGKMTPLGKSLAHPVESASEYALRKAVGASDVEQKGSSVPITKSPNFNAAEYKAGKAERFQAETEAGTTLKPGGMIVDPNSAPPDVKVTYQSIPGLHLLEKVMGGDLDAISEWQRRGLPLPENVKFLVEKGGTKPWRNLSK